MPAQKRQHFVPQFYLRFFATQGTKDRISLFHLDSGRLISSVAIDRQAYKDYFYGADKVVESAFELLEGRSAEVLRNVIASSRLPNRPSKEHHVILSFVAMLHARTLYSAEEIQESVEKLVKQILLKDPRLKEHLDKVKIGLRNPSHWAIQNMSSMIPLLADLKFQLLINKTPKPFVTSDHPVIFYNQFFEERRPWGSNTGLVSKGLQIFFPLSPRHSIIFYDSDLYRVGGIFDRPVAIRNAQDVDNLNALQYLGANKTLFFDSGITELAISSLVKEFSGYRRTKKSNVDEYAAMDGGKAQTKSLMHLSREDIRCQLSLSFINLTKNAKEFKMDNRAVYVRNETLLRIHDEFMSLIPTGAYKPSEFQRFFMDKYGPKTRS